MFKGKKILVTICARGGSKGIPGKNIRILGGKPILAYSIEAAKKCDYIDTVLVSTDDKAIQEVAIKYGANSPFMRPKKLANDSIGRIAAVVHAFQKAEKYFNEKFDVIVDLGNMAPLRTQQDIKNVIEMLVNNKKTDVVYSVALCARNPYFNMVEIGKNGYAHLSKNCKNPPSCRQQAPKVYDMNDSIYAYRRDFILKNLDMAFPIQQIKNSKQMIYVMSDESSVDIDREVDFLLVEQMIKNKQ